MEGLVKTVDYVSKGSTFFGNLLAHLISARRLAHVVRLQRGSEPLWQHIPETHNSGLKNIRESLNKSGYTRSLKGLLLHKNVRKITVLSPENFNQFNLPLLRTCCFSVFSVSIGGRELIWYPNTHFNSSL